MTKDDNAAARRIKRTILGVPQSASIRFPKGFGDICAEEVRAALAATPIKAGSAPEVTLTANAVAVTNISLADLIALTLTLSTAREVLWEILSAKRVDTAALLKTRLRSVPWELYLPQPALSADGEVLTAAAVAVRVSSVGSRLYHESRISTEVAAALGESGSKTCSSKGAAHLLDVRLHENNLVICLSVAGRPLYQRHYKRVLKGTASVKEDVAAACTRVALNLARAHHGANWQARSIVVPFAGSGTCGFEAALQLLQIPASLFFGPLSIELAACSPAASVQFARRRLHKNWLAQASALQPQVFHYCDQDALQCATLRANIESFNAVLGKAGASPLASTVVETDAFSWLQKQDLGAASFVPLNPPYGGRLKGELTPTKLYSRLGRLLGTTAASGYVLAPSPEALTAFTEALPDHKIATRIFNHGGKATHLIAFTR